MLRSNFGDEESGKRVFCLNDNIRTALLKCTSCKTQHFLFGVAPAEDGGEIRTSECPHSQRSRKNVLLATSDLRRPANFGEQAST